MIEFMTALSILKIALSGLTFTYYLGEHFLVWQDAGNAAAVIRTEKKTAVRLPADVASYAGGCMRRGVCAVRVYGGICLESDVDGLHGACAACDSGIRAADP